MRKNEYFGIDEQDTGHDSAEGTSVRGDDAEIAPEGGTTMLERDGGRCRMEPEPWRIRA